jgi:hypothetical protein
METKQARGLVITTKTGCGTSADEPWWDGLGQPITIMRTKLPDVVRIAAATCTADNTTLLVSLLFLAGSSTLAQQDV